MYIRRPSYSSRRASTLINSNQVIPSFFSVLLPSVLSIIGDRSVELRSTRSRPIPLSRLSFSGRLLPSHFPSPSPSLPLIGRLFHTHSIYLIYSGLCGLYRGAACKLPQVVLCCPTRSRRCCSSYSKPRSSTPPL
jgi:hypothetical protein